jgi:hypothetical protein
MEDTMLSQQDQEYKIVATIDQFNGELHDTGLLMFYNEHVIEGTEEPLTEVQFEWILADLCANNKITYNKYGYLEVVRNIHSI